MRKRNIKINVFINEDMDNVIHKDEITPILEQIKVLNYDGARIDIRTRKFTHCDII